MGPCIFTDWTHSCNWHLVQETTYWQQHRGSGAHPTIALPVEALSQPGGWFCLFVHVLRNPVSCPGAVLRLCDSSTLLHVGKTCSSSVLQGIPACDSDWQLSYAFHFLGTCGQFPVWAITPHAAVHILGFGELLCTHRVGAYLRVELLGQTLFQSRRSNFHSHQQNMESKNTHVFNERADSITGKSWRSPLTKKLL